MSLKEALWAAGGILILSLFPYPLGLLLALGVPLGWVYLVVYGGWILVAVLLTWLIHRRSTLRQPRWPHRRLMWTALGLLVLWYVLKNTVVSVNVALDWFIFIALGMWFLVEGALDAQRRRAIRASVPLARTR